MSSRIDGRANDELRAVRLTPDWQRQPAGGALVEFGDTRVLCSANIEEGAPRWRNKVGWVTGEYAMLPGSTNTRARRGPNGRAKEIERLIGRSLRLAVDLDQMPDVTLTVDCDVL
ncbi:MAG: ribonuclease PH, partial [Glaciecola sp.]